MAIEQKIIEHKMTPEKARGLMRVGKLNSPTAGLCPGYAQGNLVVLPKDLAGDFMRFTRLNPIACPVLEITNPGDTTFTKSAPNACITTDLPKYRVYRYGELTEERQSIEALWQDDFVSFLLGCSFTFESALMEQGIRLRHIDTGSNVSMYITNIPCEPAGIFKGFVVVSMRPIPVLNVIRAVSITSRYPKVHGAPIHIGDPAAIGIKDLSKPDFGDAVDIKDGEVPVFWACGVTPQAIAMNVRPEIMITHAPGHMLITDIKNSELAEPNV